MGCEEKGNEKGRKKEILLKKRLISKVVVRRKKTLRGKWILLPGISETATIAHTRIQRESNFANFEG